MLRKFFINPLIHCFAEVANEVRIVIFQDFRHDFLEGDEQSGIRCHGCSDRLGALTTYY